jgi:heme/copper-type cytochrome/quinol oxidase subunit 2
MKKVTNILATVLLLAAVATLIMPVVAAYHYQKWYYIFYVLGSMFPAAIIFWSAVFTGSLFRYEKTQKNENGE